MSPEAEGALATQAREPFVGRARKDDKGKKRGRARDSGAVVPLGVEIDRELHERFEAVRADKKWSKRTLVEDALRFYFDHLDKQP